MSHYCPFRRARSGHYRQFDGFRAEFVGHSKNTSRAGRSICSSTARSRMKNVSCLMSRYAPARCGACLGVLISSPSPHDPIRRPCSFMPPRLGKSFSALAASDLHCLRLQLGTRRSAPAWISVAPLLAECRVRLAYVSVFRNPLSASARIRIDLGNHCRQQARALFLRSIRAVGCGVQQNSHDS